MECEKGQDQEICYYQWIWRRGTKMPHIQAFNKAFKMS